MRRNLVVAAVAVALLAVAVASEVRLGAIDRADPLGRELLYLPSLRMLRMLSFGNDGFAADLVYIWSIQYYSQFEPDDRFLYLEKVYDLITDLDPAYFDAYWIGAMIMLSQESVPHAERQRSVVRLYDKGIAAMPDDSRLPEIAAWDMRTHFGDVDEAIRYLRIAASRPGAPNRLKRLLGYWIEDAGRWSVGHSIDYWVEVYQEAPSHQEKLFGITRLFDVLAKEHHRQLDPLLEEERERSGECPAEWRPMVERGVLEEPPVDLMGRVYPIDPDSCTIRPERGVRVRSPEELVIRSYGAGGGFAAG